VTSESALSRAEFGSDYIVELLRALGVEYAAFNPGASFRGLHDSLVNFGDRSSPGVVQVCHEEISVAIAHGYAKATGRPMAAILHNMVGLQHASMAIYNAWVDRVPILLLGGTGPVDSTLRRPWIEWIHTALVQGNLIRDFVKFDDQPASLAAVPDSLLRAYRTMMAEPCGPVYVNFDVTIQEQRVAQPLPIPEAERYVASTRLQADPAALERVADWLLAAERPAILTSSLGRNPSTEPALAQLAELTAAAVVSTGERLNLPTIHPLNLSGANREVLEQADLIVALDALDLQGGLSGATSAGGRGTARVVQIGLADLAVRSWAHDFMKLCPTDLSIVADTGLAVPTLVELVATRLDREGGSAAARPAARELRRKELAARHAQLRERWREQARREAANKPISLAFMAAEVWAAIQDQRPVLAYHSFNPWPLRLWELTEPSQYVGGSGGAGVGYGIGGAIGVALAHRDNDRLCVSLQPDGDLLYATSALWTLAHERLPLLMVMHNNRSYFNSEEHARRMAEQRGRPLARSGIGVHLTEPAVDFASVARGFGIWAEGPLEDPTELGPALRRALRVIQEERRPALLDVVTAPR
jgi:thiamine pyrophosphate-dependent acetolactate synthase large subunit-like protein